MKVAKNGIRVIKRDERTRHDEGQKIETPDRDIEPEMDKAQERELTSSVAGWVEDFLRRRHHDGFPEDMGGQLRTLFNR
jgi:hypothetical protein